MARLREHTRDVLVDAGLTRPDAERALETAWHARTPSRWRDRSATCVPVRLAPGWRRLVAVATSDDRDPTERTLAALDLTDAIDATVCADDGIPVKPAPDMVLHLCAVIGVPPERTAVVGDSPADLRMARAAGAGLTIGVLTGVGARADLEPLADAVIAAVERLRAD